MLLSTNAKASSFRVSTQIIVLLAIFIGVITSVSAHEHASVSDLKIKNLYQPNEHILASGQPDQTSFSEIAKTGVQVVVNLRPAKEQDWDEKATVESLGMSYINLPVAGAEGVTFENAKKLESILNDLEGKKVLVHCSSGNRVGALTALNAFKQNGENIEAALESGKDWGLTALEHLVREKLTR